MKKVKVPVSPGCKDGKRRFAEDLQRVSGRRQAEIYFIALEHGGVVGEQVLERIVVADVAVGIAGVSGAVALIQQAGVHSEG